LGCCPSPYKQNELSWITIFFLIFALIIHACLAHQRYRMIMYYCQEQCLRPIINHNTCLRDIQAL
jgi:hypothetical protein